MKLAFLNFATFQTFISLYVKETWFTYIAASLFFNATGEEIDYNQLPIPLPSSATTSFNFNEAYASALGPNSLPREFYIVPADVHLPMWTSTPQLAPVAANPNEELLEIWAAAKLELKNAPIFTQRRDDSEIENVMDHSGSEDETNDSGADTVESTSGISRVCPPLAIVLFGCLFLFLI